MEEAEGCIVCQHGSNCGDTDFVDVDGQPTSRLKMSRGGAWVGGGADIDQQKKTKISLIKTALKNHVAGV